MRKPYGRYWGEDGGRADDTIHGGELYERAFQSVKETGQEEGE